jgi:hypothetical protein
VIMMMTVSVHCVFCFQSSCKVSCYTGAGLKKARVKWLEELGRLGVDELSQYAYSPHAK